MVRYCFLTKPLFKNWAILWSVCGGRFVNGVNFPVSSFSFSLSLNNSPFLQSSLPPKVLGDSQHITVSVLKMAVSSLTQNLEDYRVTSTGKIVSSYATKAYR